jgi:two-component system NarL family sensor kinase
MVVRSPRRDARPAPADSERERLLRRNRELSILNAIAEGLNRAVDLGEALRAALALVADLLDLRAGWVWLLDEDSGEPLLAAAQFLPPALRDEPRRMQGSCYCLRTFRAGDMHGAANVNVIECSRLEGLVEGTEGLHFHASIPLRAGEKQLGVLNVAGQDWRGLSPEELQLLNTIGYQIGVAVERARLHARAAALATAEERTRLARELHDSLAQSLTAIAWRLETADALLETGSARARPTVGEALALTREALRETRRVVQDLRAGALQGKSLPQALRELAASYTATYGVKISMTASGPAARLAPHVEAGLFRIAQEAANNVVRHAGARRAWIRLTVGDDTARLTIRDDGRGFQPGVGEDVPSPGTGFGLTGMRERARLLGGSLRVESTPGVGTKVVATVPLAGGAPWTAASASL